MNNDWPSFLDRLVHDLKEPLRMVQTSAELLQEEAKHPGPERDRMLREIVDSSTRLGAVIDGLSRYSLALEERTEPGESSLKLALDVALAGLDDEIRASGATITADKLPNVLLRLERSAQIFENIIGNSLRFRSDAPPVVDVHARQGEAGFWLITIEDNGIGLEPADCEIIFRPLMRIHGRKYLGPGFGLAICRAIIERHHGKIWMEPRPSGGAICSFTLPAA
jgi:light-regulated signal transduction histidine kinase (bacteriophytochrome)